MKIISILQKGKRIDLTEDEFKKMLEGLKKGGPESGFHGHAGRPGERGGSSSEGGDGDGNGNGKLHPMAGVSATKDREEAPKEVKEAPKKVGNPYGKTVPVNKPHAVYREGDWEWRVLKTYQSAEKEKGNPYARWFCAVKSPMTMGSYDMGDTYVKDIPKGDVVKPFGGESREPLAQW
jgi:hypothetical protein